MQTDYGNSLNSILGILSSSSSMSGAGANISDIALSQAAITILWHEVRSKNVFNNGGEIASQFFSNFTSIVTNVFLSDNIPDNFKIIVSAILALLHVSIFQVNSNVSIPTYILTTFNTIPALRKYLINCIYEIVVSDPNFGGFSIEDLIKILISNLEDDTLYSPRMHLFYAVASIFGDLPVLHELFPQLLNIINNMDNMLDFLNYTADFSESSANFFSPHISILAPKLCEISINQSIDPKIRNVAIICIGSIVSGAPEMCFSNEAMCFHILQVLVHVASEITDDSPMDYDVNNDRTYQIALDTIGIIFSAIENTIIFQPVFQIIEQTLSDKKAPWQAVFACIASAAELSPITFTFFEDEKNEAKTAQFLKQIVLYLDLNSHPRVRMAVYSLISQLTTNSSVLVPGKTAAKMIMQRLHVIAFAENVMLLKKSAFEALTSYFSQVTNQKNVEYFEVLFPRLIQELKREPKEIQISILRLIGHLTKASRDDSVKFFPEMVNILSELINSSSSPTFRAEVIKCLSLSMSYVPVNENVVNLCAIFYQLAIPLIDNVDEETVEGLYDAIYHFINCMGPSFQPFISNILSKILEDASKPISIEQDMYKSVVDTMKSMFIRIPSISENQAVRCYAHRSEVLDVKHALHILNAIEKVDPNFGQYLEQTMGIVRNWICNDYMIEMVMTECWAICRTAVQLFKTPILCDFIFHCYINSIQKRGSSTYLQTVLEALSDSLIVALFAKWENVQIFTEILKTLPPLSEYVINMKNEKIGKIEKYYTNTNIDLDFDGKDISNHDQVLSGIAEKVLVVCFKICPEITAEFYAQTFGQLTDTYLANPNTTVFGVSLTTAYMLGTNDREKVMPFIDFLMKRILAFDIPEDSLTPIISSLGNLLLNFPLDNEESAHQILNFFFDFFSSSIVTSGNDTGNNLADFGNVSFVRFLKSNIDLVDKKAAFDILNDNFPIWDVPEGCDTYYDFLAESIEKGWIQYFGEDWLHKIFGQLLTGFAGGSFSEKTRQRFVFALYRLKSEPAFKVQFTDVINSIMLTRGIYVKEFFRPPQQQQQFQQQMQQQMQQQQMQQQMQQQQIQQQQMQQQQAQIQQNVC